jgi:glyoxylase-like metal-dependent hydrolase (beta-lactamase superfamily II)
MRVCPRSFSTMTLASLLALAPACGENPSDPDDDGSAGDGSGDDGGNDSLLDSVAAALGGADAIQAATGEHVEATGTRLDLAEAPSSGEAIEIGAYSYSSTHRLAEDRVRVEVESTGSLLVPITLDYTLVIDGREGFIEGLSDLFNPATDPRPLPSSQLATRLKHTAVTSLAEVARRMVGDPDAVSEEEDAELDGRAHRVLALASPDHPPLRLLIDPESSLPAALETLEHTPPLGDTQVQVRFADYQPAGDLILPREVAISVDGIEVQRETRSVVEPGPDDDNIYEVPEAQRTPFDEQDGHRGWISAQYHQSIELIGLPLLFDAQAEVPLEFAELAPGVFQVRGASHHVLLVEMADHLILVDAPLQEAYCDRLRTAISKRFPKKPITHVVASHFHYDHVGGIRNFGADGGLTVVAGADSADFYEAVFANPYTVEPDRYAASPEKVSIESVDDSLTLSDGERTVEVHHIESVHAADMVIVHLPEEGILFNSDLWSPEQGELVGYFLVGATELRDAAAGLGLAPDTVVVGAHSPATGTLAELEELLGEAQLASR